MTFPFSIHANAIEVVVPSDYLSLIINGAFAIAGVIVGSYLSERTRKKVEIKNEIKSLVNDIEYALAIMVVQENNVFRWLSQLCNLVEIQLNAVTILSDEEILEAKELRPIVIEDYDSRYIYQLTAVSSALPIKFFSCIDSIISINEAPKGGGDLRALFVNHKSDLLCALSCILKLKELRRELTSKGCEEIDKRLCCASWITKSDEYRIFDYSQIENYADLLDKVELCVSAIDMEIEINH